MTTAQQLQETLHYHPLQAIDAATGLPMDEGQFDALEQSVVVTFLAGLYKSSRIKENSVLLSSQLDAGLLLNEIFPDKFDAFKIIADYTGTSQEIAKSKLTEVAAAFIGIQQEKNKDNNIDQLTKTLSSERDSILALIPAGLTIGELFDDDTMNDDTHKMQGPVSTLMHKIENTFSSAD